MNWDQISDNWAAMALRLRSDKAEVPTDPGGAPDLPQSAVASTFAAAERVIVATIGRDSSHPSDT
jgi:hypothetical protein